jgi:hypothetical protein
MAMYTEGVFPTRYPLLDFHMRIWKLTIETNLMSESMESMTYQYISLFILWKGNVLYKFRLYDSYKRAVERKNNPVIS